MKSQRTTSLQKQTPINKCDSPCDRQKTTFAHGKNILKKINCKWFLLFLFTFFSLGMQAQMNENLDEIVIVGDDYDPFNNSDDNYDFSDDDGSDQYPEYEPPYYNPSDSSTPKDFTDSNPPTTCTLVACSKDNELDRNKCECVPIPIPWYLDNDDDGWYSEVKLATKSPDSKWKKTTSGKDCDDNDSGITNYCYRIYYQDDDNDGYHSAEVLSDKQYDYKTTTLGTDCDDDPGTGANVQKLNKCGKCEVEPVNGICNDKDCITNNTSNPINIKPSDAKLSQDAINLLKAIETLSLIPYDDATGKPTTKYVKGATIGYGHLITNAAEFEIYKNGISLSSANTLFTNDIDREIKSVRKLSDDLSQNQFDALAIMVFNIGPQFNSSSLRKFLEDCNAKTNYSSVENAWKAFNKDNGVLLQGLINRRKCEWDIFVNGIYKQW